MDSLEPKILAKTLRTIDLLEMNGTLLREPYSKPLENGISELRTKQGFDITRVWYFFIIGKKAALTNGFIKKSQKTPKAEKERAKKYKADYERRYDNFWCFLECVKKRLEQNGHSEGYCNANRR